ncbi:MAG: nitroreductase family protein [Muribaculaceae bacterium]|nr:nitroreductase family protein [Muribaculaceae bacterium]
MNKVIEDILSRRTIRNYKPEQIKPEELNEILETGLYAPTAGGRQSPLMLVCQNREINNILGKINRKVFGHANSDGIKFVSETQKSIADDDNIKSAFYDAPTVITLFAPKNWVYGVHDCTSMAITMALAAWSLGIGSCYVSRAEETFDTEFGKKVMKECGISPDYVASVHLCLGYPKDITNHAKPRKEGRIHFLK